VADYDLKREISSVKKTLAVAALKLAATRHAADKQRAQESPRSRPGQQQEREGYCDRDPQSPVQPRHLAGRLRLPRLRYATGPAASVRIVQGFAPPLSKR
jgi:septal ring factor EnvC (AmiA/AmiB activator)